MRLLILGYMAIFMLAACSSQVPNDAPMGDPSIFLVRHAEKTTGPDVGSDPDLSQDGYARAQSLATLLKDKNIKAIYSSDYIRTRETAAPLANALKLEVMLYDPRDLPGLAAQLKNTSVSVLVVGHSNTTPQLAEALGGEPGNPIVEATEYDRIYEIVMQEGETVSSRISRF